MKARAQAVRPTRARAAATAGRAPRPSALPSFVPSPAGVLHLQRTAGNAATAQFVVQRGGSKSEHGLSAAERTDVPAAADAPALLQEDKDLYAKKAAGTITADETKRMHELDRLLGIRRRADEEETLRQNGVKGGLDASFKDVNSTTFLGQTFNTHKLMADRLTRAEAALASETPPDGGWITNANSLREPGQGLHSLGLAVDLNPGTNPWLINPDASHAGDYENTATSRAIKDVIDDAVLLVQAQLPKDAKLQARPEGEDRAAKVSASYEKLAAASADVHEYFTLDKPESAERLKELVDALGAKSKRSAADWVRQIKADRATLDRLASGKKWRSPQSGFLDLDRRLVMAMTGDAGAGLDWLGDDTIAAGRDIMHFDLRNVGPVHSIVDSWSGSTTNLGTG